MKYYLDTEFNGFGGQLISLALVREDGQAVYYVFELTEAPDSFVAEHVLPILWDCPVLKRHWSRQEAAEDLARFLADDAAPAIVADWPDDVRHFCGLIVIGPGKMVPIPRLDFTVMPVNTYPTSLVGAVQHNAWWDAMALRRRHEELAQ